MISKFRSLTLDRLKCWSPGVRDLNGEILREWQPRRTPVYTLLSETQPRRSIVLGPLRRRFLPSTLEEEDETPTTKSSASDTPSASDIKTSSENEEEDTEEYPGAQILLAIRIDESHHGRDQWLEWMKTGPINAHDIHVEGRWGSFSALLLLRMPVEVWNLLPANPAYSFVGFVTTTNLEAV